MMIEYLTKIYKKKNKHVNERNTKLKSFTHTQAHTRQLKKKIIENNF